MENRIVKFLCVIAALFVGSSFAKAQEGTDSLDVAQPASVAPYGEWFVGVNGSFTMAFGDDSYNVLSDMKNALGGGFSVYVGRSFNKLLSARVKGSYMKLYSRVNLETLWYKDDFPELFPRDGFYGYNAFALQAEAMLNVANFFSRSSHVFNLYIIGGVGFNVIGKYDAHVADWTKEAGVLKGGWYYVDTRSHTMPTGTIGGALDFRINKNLSINAELLGTFTGDLMDGVKYEEGYDVYITASVGVTAYF